ncbi:DUF4268 domain-containing protein [Microvirga arabica]|uniref:DUF4268 domain-containing protein n=1 Tax=Microvirga arabica TaxID=1128671 RepID=UPI001939DA9E|nr:DUF4268 domain-containing protein [Microvirga arabica]MBM1170208.1 DUF4268 domain-containing protein [Microvirga arabica]
MDISLGRLQKVDLRSVWLSESADFTPWLARAENLEVLGEAVGLDLELEAQEKDVGPFRADILCKDLRTGNWVLIENQLERTDHTHLGQLLVYASGLKAATIIWVAQRFTEEHRATLDWLNAITDEEFQFFGLEVELWRIGQSEPAPKFNIVSKPNDWSRQVSQAAHRIETGELTEAKQTQLEFWTGFMKFLSTRNGKLRPIKPQPQHWVSFSIGRSGFRLDTMALVRDQGIAVNLVMGDERAKAYFHLLARDKATIQDELGMELQWKELPGKKESHVYTGLKPADFTQADRWPEYHRWLADTAEAFGRVLGPRIRALRADEWKPEPSEADL